MIISNIKSAIEDFKKGKFVIVVDGKNRENEADLVLAAQKVTPDKINFMIKYARGLVCVPMLGKRLDELNLPLMSEKNTEFTKCAFTVSVDAKKGTTTGVSAFDRANTIKALIGRNTKPGDLARPGHVFPLRCDKNGLINRAGHTEAAIELCRLANIYAAAVICEIVGENGRMAGLAEIRRFVARHNLSMIMINDLLEYLIEYQKL